MPKFLRTKGRARLSVAFCDRCAVKFPIDDLRADGDKPGLRVCRRCWDSIDPWRLPPPIPEDISIPDATPNDLIPETP